MNLIQKAAAFARQAHAEQRRKHSSRPYIVHPARVAGRVAAHLQATEAMIAAAFLHDVVENALCTLEEVSAEFGPEIARLVEQLTTPANSGNDLRHERQHQDRDFLIRMSTAAKIIKMLDRIEHLADMADAPVAYRRKYCDESRLLAEVIGDAAPELKAELLDCLDRLEGV